MGDFKIGNITPSSGELKVGDIDVSRAYFNNTIVFGQLLTFNENLGTSAEQIRVIAIHPQGNKILVGGGFSSFNGNSVNRIVRLNPNGTEDINFSNQITPGVGGSNPDYRIEDIVVLPNGEILVGGDFKSFAGVNGITNLAKFNSSGELDLVFESNIPDLQGGVSSTPITSIFPQSDGKILLTRTNDSAVFRLLSTGAPDTAFNTNVAAANVSMQLPYSIIELLDNTILVGGAITYNSRATYIGKLNSDGTLNTTFMDSLAGGFNSTVTKLVEQPDGKILIGGDFSSYKNGYSGTPNGLIRINPDSTPDIEFNNNLGAGFTNSFAIVNAICIQTLGDDYKILVGGNFSNFNGNVRYELVRLNSDGTEDVDFYNNLGTGFGIPSEDLSNRVADIKIDYDGNIVIAFIADEFNGIPGKNILKLNADGTLYSTVS